MCKPEPIAVDLEYDTTPHSTVCYTSTHDTLVTVTTTEYDVYCGYTT